MGIIQLRPPAHGAQAQFDDRHQSAGHFAGSRNPTIQVGVPIRVSIRKGGFCYSLGRTPRAGRKLARNTSHHDGELKWSAPPCFWR